MPVCTTILEMEIRMQKVSRISSEAHQNRTSIKTHAPFEHVRFRTWLTKTYVHHAEQVKGQQ